MTDEASTPPAKANTPQTGTTATGKIQNKSRKKCVAQRIGKRCTVPCAINGVPLQMLFDSRAQVTIVGRDWVEKELPDVKIQPIETLLTGHPLAVNAANGTAVPFEGWIDVTLDIVGVNNKSVAVQVPMLVGQSCVSFPLLGSNITEIIKWNEHIDGLDISVLLREALSIGESAAKAIVSILSATVSDGKETAPQFDVKVGKGLNIPASQVGEVRCRVRAWPGGGDKIV